MTPDNPLDAPHDRPSRIPWPPILLVTAVAVAVIGDLLVPLPWPGIDDMAARVVGRAIGIGGIVMILWAAFTLYRARTTILPHRAADNLVTTGAFARFRNPIYLGDVMMLLGLAELTKNPWFVIAAAIFVLAITKLAILPEERHLEARFGDKYRDYKSRSRRWI
ncbi:MAG: methyltransferase family protein [Hyphomicrobiaceae bacterium]